MKGIILRFEYSAGVHPSSLIELHIAMECSEKLARLMQLSEFAHARYPYIECRNHRLVQFCRWPPAKDVRCDFTTALLTFSFGVDIDKNGRF